MTNLINLITEFWLVVTMIAGGIGSFLAWYSKREKEEKNSTTMLFEQLEELKKKIIVQVNNEIKTAKDNAEKEKIINLLRLHCPECYSAVIEKIINEG